MSERLEDKFCSVIKKKCLLDGCAQYDLKLKNCAWNLLPLNIYFASKAIEHALPGGAPPPQPTYPGFPGRY